MVPEIWSVTDKHFVVLGHFLPFHPTNNSKNQNLEKMKKNSWRYYHFTQVHQKSWSYAILFLRYCTWQMDTVINVVPNPDISKTHEIKFFQLYQKYKFLYPEILSGYIWVWYGTIQYKKLEFFLGKMAGKDGKVTFCYISISYLKIEIRYFFDKSIYFL